MTEAEAMEKQCCARVSVLCLASRCMAWRWVKNSSDQGYCGLASEPASTTSEVK